VSARRIILRRWWVDECPPHFNSTGKNKVAIAMSGKPMRPRLSFSLCMLKTFRPKKYAELQMRANGEKPITTTEATQ